MNVVERSFRLSHSVDDDPNAIVAAIARRVIDLETNFCLKGPFILQVPDSWKDALLFPYPQHIDGQERTLFDRILEERIKGFEFRSLLAAEPPFQLIWRCPDIRTRL